MVTAEQIGSMKVPELLDLKPEIKRYLLRRIPDI